MALTLNTPGVYVEEINSLPPSVAQVATAIPAFIGYTEKAVALDGSPLRPDTTFPPVPVRITSMLDYETQFGKADPEKLIKVSVKGNTIKSDLAPADRSKFLLYYSMQMYFANGGGPCYIVSVGDYDVAPDRAILETGLKVLEKEDEPTLILAPDAVSLPGTDAYDFYNLVLKQCVKLQDRFGIFDAIMTNLTTINPDVDFSTLRNSISNDPNEVKYGASYYPYIKSSLDYQYKEENTMVSITQAVDYGAEANALNQGAITNAQGLLASSVTAIGDYSTTAAAAATTDAEALALIPDITSTVNQVMNVNTSVIASLNALIDIADDALASDPGNAHAGAVETARDAIEAWIATPTAVNNDLPGDLGAFDTAADKADVAAGLTTITTTLGQPNSIAAQLATLQAGSIATLIAELGFFSSNTTTMSLAALKLSNNVLYNNIRASITQIPVLLPSGSSVAGIYARTDAANGVWKSPANTSISLVVGPNYVLSNEQQGRMNIDDSGKSINAIRSFTGKGTLVWGARTLAGGSNEWKYISVRRFYNMVEESVKKATEGFVFQSNDANTWVQVRAMIENFLILQWKAGALAGAKPEQAFYVKVGLGSTMTADDVLNGRMIVEIGMAVVRPAEFIVLRFSHMMQQA